MILLDEFKSGVSVSGSRLETFLDECDGKRVYTHT